MTNSPDSFDLASPFHSGAGALNKQVSKTKNFKHELKKIDSETRYVIGLSKATD